MALKTGWYATSTLGKLVAAAYACTPAWLVYAQIAGFFPASGRWPVAAGCAAIGGSLLLCRARGYKLFSKDSSRKGFTLLELLIVISIIGILASIVFPVLVDARKAAYVSRTKTEMRNIALALEMYYDDHGAYPPDANRDLPPGLEVYLSGNQWPAAPWPGSVYDWDNWAPGDLAYNPKEQIYQISVRFCPLGEPTQCVFPNEPWAAGFDYYSSVYYCVSGSCRAHSSKPTTHPAKCFNCEP